MTARQPVLFLSHGSPLTALGGDELNRTAGAGGKPVEAAGHPDDLGALDDAGDVTAHQSRRQSTISADSPANSTR